MRSFLFHCPIYYLSLSLCLRLLAAVAQEHIWRGKCGEVSFPPLDLFLSTLSPSPDVVDFYEADFRYDYPRYFENCIPQKTFPEDLMPDYAKCTYSKSLSYKRLYFSLAAAAVDEPFSLIARPLLASSTDQPEEALQNVLHPICGPDNENNWQVVGPLYWSSGPSDDENSKDSVAFRLAHPLCVVTGIQIRPFKAYFQPGNPIYAPKAIRIRLGGPPCFNLNGQPYSRQHCSDLAAVDMGLLSEDALRAAHIAAGRVAPSTTTSGTQHKGDTTTEGVVPEQEGYQIHGKCGPRFTWAEMRWVSHEIPLAKEDRLQTIRLPPTLCVGGYLQIDLLGRTQRQEADDRWYSEFHWF